MKKKAPAVPFFMATLIAVTFYAGCNSGNRPLSPSKPYSLTVSVSTKAGVHPSLFSAPQNEILYRVDGGPKVIQGKVGPFSTSGSSGSFNFTIDGIPKGGDLLLSLQLNDASTHLPLAIGAARFSNQTTALDVELGSVSRSCYAFTGTSTYATGMSYSFGQDAVTFGVNIGATYDMGFGLGPNGFVMQSALSAIPSNIAYLGNGSFVDYDLVPPASAFYGTSSAAKSAAGAPASMIAGDIYCLKLGTIPNAN